MISRNTKMKRRQRKELQKQSTQLMAMKAAANAVCNHMVIHGVPKAAKEWLEKYQKENPDFKPETLADIAAAAGVTRRISCLLSIFMQLSNAQNLLLTEMEQWMDGFGMTLKGVRPWMNALQHDGKKFMETITPLMNGSMEESMTAFRLDTDAIFHKILRWNNTPYAWKPGDPLIVDSLMEEELEKKREENLKTKANGRKNHIWFETSSRLMSVSKTKLKDEVLTKTDWSIGQIIHEDDNKIVRSHLESKESAIRIAKRMLSKSPNAVFVVFETDYKTTSGCTLWPSEAITKAELDRIRQAKKEYLKGMRKIKASKIENDGNK